MKSSNLFRSFFAAAFLSAVFAASADDYYFVENGIQYEYVYDSSTDSYDYSKCCVGTLYGADDYKGDIVIPEKVQNGKVDVVGVANYAFYPSPELTSVVLPNSILFIGTGAFQECTSLANVDFGAGLKSIGEEAFSNCRSLKSVTIPDNVETILQDGFGFCDNLEEVNLGTGLKVLGEFAFEGCDKLKAITIPDKMETIERYCVRDCSALEKVVLGNSLKTIEHGAFEGCPNIAEVTSKNPVPPAIEMIDSRPFDSVVYEEAVLRVPIGSGDAYREAPEWEKFVNIEETELGGVEGVASDAVSVTANGGSIEIGGADNARVEVYNLSGQFVYSGTETTVGGLARGIYIVRVAGQTFKVAL